MSAISTVPLLAYWLVPAEPQRSELTTLIRRLAASQCAPSFVPHITIYAANSAEPERRQLDEKLRGSSCITLKTTRIAWSETFTKTLFIELARSKSLEGLSKRLRDLTPIPADYRLAPHLSLLYKKMPATELRLLARQTSLQWSEILCNEIHVITGNPAVNTAVDVESWRVVYTHRLEP
jgi:2'-5' RNA ligase